MALLARIAASLGRVLNHMPTTSVIAVTGEEAVSLRQNLRLEYARAGFTLSFEDAHAAAVDRQAGRAWR
jgi:hypothetical protein